MQRIQPTKSHSTLGIISCSMKLNPSLEAKSIVSETAKSIPIDSK
jgi:glycine cleavage system protein P-like pyridoxal-binding family